MRQPRLIRDNTGDYKLKVSLPGGRYQLSLNDPAIILLTNQLDVSEQDTIPAPFVSFFLAKGDAWFPNQREIDGVIEYYQSVGTLTSAERSELVVYLTETYTKAKNESRVWTTIENSPFVDEIDRSDLQVQEIPVLPETRRSMSGDSSHSDTSVSKIETEHAQSSKAIPDSTESPSETQNSLTDIPGIGDSYASTFRNNGFRTISDIADTSPAVLVENTSIPPDDVDCIQVGAKETRGDDGTPIATVADDTGTRRATVADAYATIVGLRGDVPDKAAALRELFSSSESIFDLEDQSLYYLYSLYQAGYHDIQSVADASIDELTTVPYITYQAAEIRSSARKLIGGAYSEDKPSPSPENKTISVSEETEAPYICPDCEKEYQFERVMEKHRYSCEEVNDSDNSSTESEESPYICPDCGKEYQFERVMEKHRYSCNGETVMNSRGRDSQHKETPQDESGNSSGKSTNAGIHTEFTQSELSRLSTGDDESYDSGEITARFHQIKESLTDLLRSERWLDEFSWDGSPGSPYVGPANPDESEYIWVGLAHELYQSHGKPTKGLQFEFGLDTGSNRGFFDQEVICGLYFGPWAEDSVVSEVHDNLQFYCTDLVEFLSEHPEYVLARKAERWDEVTSDDILTNVDALTSGFALTVDLTIEDLYSCEDVCELVTQSFAEVLPLYVKLAGLEEKSGTGSTTNRCQYTWVTDQQDSPRSRSHCCYRPTWRDFDRCIWHAETSKTKPATELEEVREHPDNRKLNRSPRELLSGATIQNAELTGEILTKVDLSGAELANANLRNVYLQYANLSNANLQGANLTQNTVSKVSFRHADLRNADLSGLSLYHADFTGAELSNAEFTDANVDDAEFTRANTEDAIGISDTEAQSNDGQQTDRSREEKQVALSQDGLGTSDEQPSSNRWDVDSLAAATTLDIDDIEDAVDRLTTAGCSQYEALWYVRRYLTDMLRGDGLFAVYSVGPSSGHTLVEAGITTVEELLAATPQSLSERTDLSTQRIQTIQRTAKAEKFVSLDPDDEQMAEQLLEFAEKRPDWDGSSSESDVNRDETDETDRVGGKSSRATTEKDASTTASSGNLNTEILSPSELVVPAREQHTTPDGDVVFSNYLSEYYEAFHSAKNVLARVFQIPGSDIDPEDRTDPRVQYYILLDACIGFGEMSTPFAGYGPQHQDRLPFSIQNYRTIFGDSETVTDYQVINVKRFGEDTHDLLRAKADTDSSTEFVRPCVPGTESPIPELPGSFDELQQAAKLLNTFPAYPPLPTENGVSSRTIPIAEIYETCFGDLDPEYQIDSNVLSAAEESQPTGPVTDATPKSATEAESKLVDYGKLSHLFRRITPPAQSRVDRALNVFALDWYRQSSTSFSDLTALAKYGEETAVETFRPRLQDLIHRRFLLDNWDYDYITVFPSHEANSLSPQLVQLAQDAVLDTKIIYTPLLERTETVERQREKSEQERHKVAIEPEASLRARTKLDGETVILFDDICTTGSSLSAGAHLLRQAGAGRVVCLTLGLTPGGPLENVTEIEDPGALVSNIIAGVDR